MGKVVGEVSAVGGTDGMRCDAQPVEFPSAKIVAAEATWCRDGPGCFIRFRRMRVSSYTSKALLLALKFENVERLGGCTGCGLCEMSLQARNEAGLNVRGSQKKPPPPNKAQKLHTSRKKHPVRPLGWDDVDNPDATAGAATKALTKEQAQALRAKDPPVSPWRVVGTQAVLGVVLALSVALFTGRQEWAWSMLYGAAVVVVPGALMARGMTSRLSSMSPGASAGSFMVWEAVKVLVSVAMLLLAPKVVQLLSWPALLAGLVLCVQVYWVALLWRGPRPKTS